MQFARDEETLLFEKTVADYLARECPPARLRALWSAPSGRDRALWADLAKLGVAGLLVPEAHDGLGRDERDLAPLLVAAGRAGIAEPLVASAAVGAPLLVELGDAELCERWLPRLARGEALLAAGHPELEHVPDAHVADLLLLPHAGELHAVARSDATLAHQPTNDPARRIFEVRFTPVPASRVADGERARSLLAAAFDRGALATAALALGTAERLLDLAVSHAQQRMQFGKPIGAFQAVKHQLANVKLRIEYARPVVERASWSVARALPRRPLDVSHAKLAACEAAAAAARTALQVHGALGYTWEHDLHLFMRRAWSLALDWGDSALHRARVAEHVLRPGARLGPGHSFDPSLGRRP